MSSRQGSFHRGSVATGGSGRRRSQWRSSVSAAYNRSSEIARSSLRSSFVSVTAATPDSPRLSFFTTICVIVNYISIGYLFLPWAFAQAGTVLSCLGLFLVSGQSFITATYVLEACARASALSDWRHNTHEGRTSTRRLELPGAPKIKPKSMRDAAKEVASMRDLDLSIHGKDEGPTAASSSSCKDDTENVVNYGATSSSVRRESKTTAPGHLHTIGTHRFEMSELSRIFLGEKLRNLFVLTTALDLYGITWSFTIVSASSLSENMPILDNDNDYELYIALFALVVVPLSCVPIIDQLIVQMAFLVGRTVMVALMLGTVAAAFRATTPHFGNQVGPNKDVPTFDFAELYIMLQVAIFSTAYQFSVPCMSEITQDSKRMIPIFGCACSYIWLTTMILSLMLAIFFGRAAIETSSNLNWSEYTGGTGGLDPDQGTWTDEAKWAKAISGYVVCFPAFDALAVFPLCAIGLGETLMGAWYGVHVHKFQDDWKRRTVFRLIASIPQIVAAAFVNDIDAVATYAGIFTVASYTICPSLLAIFSRKLVVEVGLSPETHYRTPFSSNVWAWSLCIVASLLIVYVIVSSALND